MSTTWTIFLNGPKGCGKDTLADHLANEFTLWKYKMRKPIDLALKGFLNLKAFELDRFFESEKDQPWEPYGLTPREMMISFSEDWAKLKFGQDIFGKLLADRALDRDIVISDGRFLEEAAAVLAVRNPNLAMGINIYRPGHTFVGDSGDYIDYSVLGIHSTSVTNDGSIQDYQRQGCEAVRNFFFRSDSR